jgi:hypothetical protein
VTTPTAQVGTAVNHDTGGWLVPMAHLLRQEVRIRFLHLYRLPCIVAILQILTPWFLLRVSNCLTSTDPIRSCGNAGARSISADGTRLTVIESRTLRLSLWALQLLGLRRSSRSTQKLPGLTSSRRFMAVSCVISIRFCCVDYTALRKQPQLKIMSSGFRL